MTEKLAEYKRLLTGHAKSQVPIQTEWVKVKSVDWENKTMVAVGELNDLDYEDILLGLGNCYKKPVEGSLATIGIINNSAACFMIDCEEVEEIEITDKMGFKCHLKDGQLTINGDAFGGIVKIQELNDNLENLKTYCEALKSSIASGLSAVGIGSAANGGTGSQKFNSGMAGQSLDFDAMENETIKHGDGE